MCSWQVGSEEGLWGVGGGLQLEPARESRAPPAAHRNQPLRQPPGPETPEAACAHTHTHPVTTQRPAPLPHPPCCSLPLRLRAPLTAEGLPHTAHLAAHRPQNERPLRTRSRQAGNTGSNPTLVRASHARSPRSLRGTDPPWYLRRSPPAPPSRVFCSVSVLDTQERAPSCPARARAVHGTA